MHFRRLLMIGAALVAVLAIVGPPVGPTGAALIVPQPSNKLDPRIRMMAQRVQDGLPPVPTTPPGSTLLPVRPVVNVRTTPDGRYLVPALARLTDPSAVDAIRALGCQVTSFSDGIACFDMPLDVADQVAALASVVRVEAATHGRLKLNLSVPETGATAANAQYGVTGKGVIVGIVDSGLDVRHPDFIAPDGTPRVLLAWDQTDTSGPSPAGYGYGREYTANDIARALVSATAPRPRDDDPTAEGHGTHVTGIAASNGRATGKYKGMAPETDIILVKTDFDHALDANRYIAEKAQALGKPVVINNSWGDHIGPHDGTDLVTAGINALVGPGIKGRAIIFAAGNEGQDPIHLSGTLRLGNPAQFSIYTPRGIPDVELDVWYSAGDRFSTSVGYTTTSTSPTQGAVAVTRVVQADAGTVRNAPVTAGTFAGTVVTVDATDVPFPDNSSINHIMVSIDMSNTFRGGQPDRPWVVTLTKTAGSGDGKFDAWVPGDYGESFRSAPGELPGDSKVTVSNQACAPNVVAVGSYVMRMRWTNVDGLPVDYSIPGVQVGGLSEFTSIGPTRTGQQKPDLVAPGEWIASALSEDIQVPRSHMAVIADDGMHQFMQGTSMSAPHVTGAIALLLQRNPSLDGEQILQLLRTTARPVGSGGWQPDSGAGKLDVLSAMQSPLLNPVTPGDVNGDGRITIADAILALQIAIGVITPTQQQLIAAEVAPPPGTMGRPATGSPVTVGDAARILRRALGLEPDPWP